MSTGSTTRTESDAPPATMRFSGSIAGLTAESRHALFDRGTSTDDEVRQRTAELIARVRRDGDVALFAIARELDRVELPSIEIERSQWKRSLDAVAPSVRRAMERSIENVRRVHEAFVPRARSVSPEPGIVIGRRPDPLGRVGVYAPGGRAAYPSSVIMGVVPAKVAGVGEIALCSPPQSDGRPSDVVLAAAELTAVDRVFALGGAGAIAAMAFGTETVPRVDRIVGPGNAYVAEAKLQVSSVVAIDSPAGPSELLIIADEQADPAIVARELVAQAEHDPAAFVLVIVVRDERRAAIRTALDELADRTPRREIVRAALAANGGLLSCANLQEAVTFANAYAPEHLLLCIAPGSALDDTLARVRNAGTVFVGERASVAFGDYMTGANHVLPTGGLARSYSGLSTADFVRWTTLQRVDAKAAASLSEDVAVFAESEGLPAHAAAARAWGADSGAGGPPQQQNTFAISRTRDPASAPATMLARPEVQSLRRYQPDEGECEIDVSDNTNLWGPSPAAQRAIAAAASCVSRYPSLYGGILAERICTYLGLRGADVGVVTGCGSDDVLDSAMRAFGEPGDAIGFSSPTFAMIPTYARLNALEARPVALTEEYDVDPDRLLATRAKVIYLCAPNNPTATGISRAAVEYILDRAPGIVVIDEAYAEFNDQSVIDLVTRSDRVLITRTFSKAFGLAGLRVGYGVGHPTLTAMIERARGPYKVSALAEQAALASLEDSDDGLRWVRAHAALARENVARLDAELRALALEPMPSQANFLFVPVRNATDIGRQLRDRGILVRTHSGLPTELPALAASGGEALRIAVGPWEIVARVVDSIRSVLRA